MRCNQIYSEIMVNIRRTDPQSFEALTSGEDSEQANIFRKDVLQHTEKVSIFRITALRIACIPILILSLPVSICLDFINTLSRLFVKDALYPSTIPLISGYYFGDHQQSKSFLKAAVDDFKVLGKLSYYANIQKQTHLVEDTHDMFFVCTEQHNGKTTMQDALPNKILSQLAILRSKEEKHIKKQKKFIALFIQNSNDPSVARHELYALQKEMQKTPDLIGLDQRTYPTLHVSAKNIANILEPIRQELEDRYKASAHVTGRHETQNPAPFLIDKQTRNILETFFVYQEGDKDDPLLQMSQDEIKEHIKNGLNQIMDDFEEKKEAIKKDTNLFELLLDMDNRKEKYNTLRKKYKKILSKLNTYPDGYSCIMKEDYLETFFQKEVNEFISDAFVKGMADIVLVYRTSKSLLDQYVYVDTTTRSQEIVDSLRKSDDPSVKALIKQKQNGIYQLSSDSTHRYFCHAYKTKCFRGKVRSRVKDIYKKLTAQTNPKPTLEKSEKDFLNHFKKDAIILQCLSDFDQLKQFGLLTKIKSKDELKDLLKAMTSDEFNKYVKDYAYDAAITTIVTEITQVRQMHYQSERQMHYQSEMNSLLKGRQEESQKDISLAELFGDKWDSINEEDQKFLQAQLKKYKTSQEQPEEHIKSVLKRSVPTPKPAQSSQYAASSQTNLQPQGIKQSQPDKRRVTFMDTETNRPQ